MVTLFVRDDNKDVINAGKTERTSKKPSPFCNLLEATIGFEPMVKVLQTSALPLGYVAD